MVIEITVDSNAEEAKLLLERIDGVENVETLDESQLRFVFNGTREQIGGLLKLLMDNGVVVRWFKEDEADLENVFMGITGQLDE
jgi:histidinol-phosphate/aromatic aminotransferase/cobyric acid decarboxylase-like protein